jgi:hypothetical protein
MSLVSYSTTESILESLKTYIKHELKDSQHLIRTVKSGLIDDRDELSMVTILPLLETTGVSYNDGLFSIERTFRLDIIDKAFKIEDVRNQLKNRLVAINSLFSIKHLKWNLITSDGDIQVFDFELGRESVGEPNNNDNFYTQFASIPLSLKSYIHLQDTIIPTEIIEITLPELLDYLYLQAKNEFPVFETYYRDVIKPTSLSNFPTLGIFIDEPDDNKNFRTSTNLEDLTIIYRVYSSLATREIAFINHLRNVDKVRDWIYKRPSLNGQVENFKIRSIDYGIDSFKKPFQGGENEYPVFRSDITTTCSLVEFKYS